MALQSIGDCKLPPTAFKLNKSFLLSSDLSMDTILIIVASVIKWIVLLQQPLRSTRKIQEVMARTVSIESLLKMIRSGLAAGDKIKL